MAIIHIARPSLWKGSLRWVTERLWALFKRQIVGTHRYLSPKHIGRYLSEMTWRFNARAMEEGERVNALIAQTTGRLTYKELIA